jgi:hypothetical protein
MRASDTPPTRNSDGQAAADASRPNITTTYHGYKRAGNDLCELHERQIAHQRRMPVSDGLSAPQPLLPEDFARGRDLQAGQRPAYRF